MLLTRISIPPPPDLEPEDIFEAAFGTLFTDDTVNSHGTPGTSIIYQSPLFGDINLHIPAHPDIEEGRKLFAHYLWNAAVIAAEAIESSSNSNLDDGGAEGTFLAEWNEQYFDLRDKKVLELGAGKRSCLRTTEFYSS
jgi:hypothetical protein